ncbi:MAG: hypothetical protein ACFFD4_21315 [Candidatus Odinarchaeota archaeon]
MSGIPKIFLRKTFVRNSCKNIGDDSFVFQLKNPIGSGTVTEIYYFKLNDENIPLDNVTCYRTDEGPEAITQVKDINADNPYVMNSQGAVHFTVKGFQLKPGDNKLELSFFTEEVGNVEFDVSVKG